MVDFCLFEQRHELPTTALPLFISATSYDVGDMGGHKSQHFDSFLELSKVGARLYVTGFTPALVFALKELSLVGGRATLLHYNPKDGSYQEQEWYV